MATFAELRTASEDPTLNIKVQVACVLAAEAIRTEAVNTVNHAARLAWAKTVYANPLAVSRAVLWSVLAQNASFTLAQITGAADATVLTAVLAAVDALA